MMNTGEIERRERTVTECEHLFRNAVRALRKRGWGQDTSEDAVAEAILRLRLCQPEPTNPLAWLTTTAVRIGITAWQRDELRRAGFTTRVPLDGARMTAINATAEEKASTAETILRVRAALDSLCPTERRVIELHTDGHSQAAIAKMCGCHRNTVHKRLSRAADRLRQLLVEVSSD